MSRLVTLLISSVCAFSLHAQSFDWKTQSILEGENMRQLVKASDGTATLVGYGNTILRSTNNGTTWTDPGIITENDNFDYQSISFSGDVGYAVAMSLFKAVDREENDIYVNSPILKTEDGGLTWQQLSIENMGEGTNGALNIAKPGNAKRKFSAVQCINDSTAYVAAYWADAAGSTHNNVFKTSNGGESWTVVLPDLGSHAINSLVAYNKHLYLAGNSLLYKVNISDNTVTDLYPIVDEGEDDAMYFWNISLMGEELFFPTTADSIRYTDNEGASFRTLPNIKKGHYVYKYDESTYLVAGTKTTTKASIDGGNTWVDCNVGASIWNMELINDSLVGLAKNSIHKMAVTDLVKGDFTWTETAVPGANGNLKDMELHNGMVFLVGYGDCFMSTPLEENTFAKVEIPTKKELIHASIGLELVGLSHGDDGGGIITSRRYKFVDYSSVDDWYVPGCIFTTSDNWESYKVLNETKIGAAYGDDATKNPYAENCWGQDYYAASCINDSTYCVFVQWYDTITSPKTTHYSTFKTENGGESWTEMAHGLINGTITSLSFSGELGYIGGNKTFIKTNNGGADFVDLYPKLVDLADASIYINEINLISEDTLFVTTTSDGVFRSIDAGETFTKLEGAAGGNGTIVLGNNTWMTVGTSSKTKFTNNAGSSWENSYPGATLYAAGDILGDTLFALGKTYLYKLAVADLLEDVENAIDEPLNQNAIKVWFANEQLNVKSSSKVASIILYNLSGKVVAQHYNLNPETSVNTGNIPSGIYIANVNSGNQTITKKFMLHK